MSLDFRLTQPCRRAGILKTDLALEPGHSIFFFEGKTLNLISGLEFNRTRQYFDLMYEGHFASATEATYNMNCITALIGIRLNMGSSTKIFVETGGYADLMISSGREGKMHIFVPDNNNHLIYKEFRFIEKNHNVKSRWPLFRPGDLHSRFEMRAFNKAPI